MAVRLRRQCPGTQGVRVAFNSTPHRRQTPAGVREALTRARTGGWCRTVAGFAIGTQEVTSNITGVSDGANGTGSTAPHPLAAAGKLAQQADELRQEVGHY